MRSLRIVLAALAAAVLLASLAVVAFAAPSSVARSAAPAGATAAQYGGGVAPDLSVALTASPATVAPNDGVLIRATVRNKPERGGADNVVVTITIPDELEVTSTSANRGPGKCTGTTSLRCSLDFMSPIHVGVINVEARTKSAGTAVVTARVASAQKDDNPADNTDSVTVTIRVPSGGGSTGGGSTEGKTVTGTSGNDVIGGTARNDNLSGGGGNDRISGGAGNDRVSGGAGNDKLNGGTGRDTILGGAGNDAIASRDRERDNVDCGTGRDSVIADRLDRIARNCERVSRK